MSQLSLLEAEFAIQIRAAKLPASEREYRFHPLRKFRVDFAWPELKIAIEIDGATFTQGRHIRGMGYRNDCIKANLLSCSGWSLLKGDAHMVRSGDLLKSLEELIKFKEQL